MRAEFSEIIDAIMEGRIKAMSAVHEVLDAIEADPRMAGEVVPITTACAIRDLTEQEDRAPGTYAEAVPMVRRLLLDYVTFWKDGSETR